MYIYIYIYIMYIYINILVSMYECAHECVRAHTRINSPSVHGDVFLQDRSNSVTRHQLI